MAINDITHNEVRMRNQEEFIQVPNNIQAASALVDGQFVYYDSSGMYDTANQDIQATHLVIKSGTHRLTASEIANNVNTVNADEPVIAVTGGPGIVTLQFGADVLQGNDLTLNAAGLAVPWDADTGSTGAYVVGKALEDVTEDSNGDRWGDAIISLPASYSPTTTV